MALTSCQQKRIWQARLEQLQPFFDTCHFSSQSQNSQLEALSNIFGKNLSNLDFDRFLSSVFNHFIFIFIFFSTCRDFLEKMFEGNEEAECWMVESREICSTGRLMTGWVAKIVHNKNNKVIATCQFPSLFFPPLRLMETLKRWLKKLAACQSGFATLTL